MEYCGRVLSELFFAIPSKVCIFKASGSKDEDLMKAESQRNLEWTEITPLALI